MTIDIKTLTDKQFYGEKYENNGYFDKALNSTTEAASKVWAEVLDNTKDESRKPKFGRAEYFDAADFDAIKAGDVLAVGNIDVNRNRYATRVYEAGDCSLAEWVGRTYRPPSLYVVVKRTAKRITVFSVDNPAGHFDRDFSLNREREQIDYWAEVWGNSSLRFLVNLGNRDDLLKAIEGSKAYARWTRCKTAAVAARDEHNRRYEAQQAAEKAALEAAVAPYKPVAKALNKALGHNVFAYGENGVSRRKGWEAVPTEVLRLAYVGRITESPNETDTEVFALLAEHAVV